MNLVVDIGNTLVKVAVVEGVDIHQLEVVEEYTNQLQLTIKSMVDRYAIKSAIVCSTRGEQREVINALEEMVDRVVVFNSDTAIPISINYLTPNTLGRDRVAAVVGAREVYGERDMLIIDCGTAITIDLYSVANGFEGGFISPGVSMRLHVLNEQTATLPLCKVNQSWSEVEIARTTQEAIVGGVMRGIVYEIEGHIRTFERKIDEISIIFIGGGAKYFDKQIKNAIFANRNLVMVGLNKILLYNV
ncbi:MAG: type III pantothenate kinase [Rikenellaceae bacterium]